MRPRHYGPPGYTKDKTEPGTILKLKNLIPRFNRNLQNVLDHSVYIWILRKGILRKGRQARDRNYHIVVVWIPKAEEKKKATIIQKKSIQHDSLQTFMRRYGGYEVVTEDCRFTYKDISIAKFYREIGLL